MSIKDSSLGGPTLEKTTNIATLFGLRRTVTIVATNFISPNILTKDLLSLNFDIDCDTLQLVGVFKQSDKRINE